MKVVFTFPGQGSQYVGMGKELYDNFGGVRLLFEEACDTLGFDVKKMCFEGPEEALKITANTQPALFTVNVACLLVLQENGLSPHAVAGHSLGEYAALVAADSMKFSEALSLVRKRGQLMQDCAPANGGMAAVLGLGKEFVRQACQEAGAYGLIEVANYNSPGQIVIAGEQEALSKAVELCKGYGAKLVVNLQVSGPFHTSLMAAAGDRLAEELAGISVSDPAYPLVSNVTAALVTSGAEIKDLLVRQICSSVLWEDSLLTFDAMGMDTYIEVGPGKVLTGLAKKTLKGSKLLNIENVSTLENILDNLKEVI